MHGSMNIKQNYKLEKELKKQRSLVDVYQGGEGPHWTVVPSKKKEKKKKLKKKQKKKKKKLKKKQKKKQKNKKK